MRSKFPPKSGIRGRLLHTALIGSAMCMLSLAACRKPLQPQVPPQAEMMNVQAGQDVLLPYRKISPYSLKTVRAIREMATQLNDSVLNARILHTLKPQNYHLYYKIVPTSNTVAAFNQWLDNDTNRMVLTMPLDSISMYPHLYSDSLLDRLQEEKKAFYTTVSLSQPLPTPMQAEVLDTLYVPDDSETFLDLALNVFTANLSPQFLQRCLQEDTFLYSLIMDIKAEEAFLKVQNVGGTMIVTPGSYPPGMGPLPHFRKMGDIPEMPGGTGTITPRVSTGGRITFSDNTLGLMEGIMDVKVTAVRFLIIPVIYWRRTDENGRFETSLPTWGFATINYAFQNPNIKIRSIDFASGFVGDAVSVLGYSLSLNIVANHFKVVDPISDINALDVNFGHGTKAALWGITYNGIQEANNYASD